MSVVYLARRQKVRFSQNSDFPKSIENWARYARVVEDFSKSPVTSGTRIFVKWAPNTLLNGTTMIFGIATDVGGLPCPSTKSRIFPKIRLSDSKSIKSRRDIRDPSLQPKHTFHTLSWPSNKNNIARTAMQSGKRNLTWKNLKNSKHFELERLKFKRKNRENGYMRVSKLLTLATVCFLLEHARRLLAIGEARRAL